MQCIDGALCQGSSLVEAALFVLCPVERNGDNEQFSGSIGDELRDRRGKYRAKTTGGGMYPVVLQRVNGGAHPAVVCSKRHGTCKGRRRKAAGAAEMGN